MSAAKTFEVGQLVETKRHSFYMQIGEKVGKDSYKCFFGKAMHQNGVFDHKRYAGIYSADDLEIYK